MGERVRDESAERIEGHEEKRFTDSCSFLYADMNRSVIVVHPEMNLAMAFRY